MTKFRRLFLVMVFPALGFLLLCFTPVYPVDKPLHPTIYAAPSGGIELYWFYPGMHVDSLGIVHSTGDGLYVSSDDHQYSILTRFPVNPPVLVTQVSTFIVNQDFFSEIAGDQFTPIGFSVKQRRADGDFSDYWQQLVGLDSNVVGNGAHIECSIDLLLDSMFEVWTGLEWQPGYPTAPLVGLVTGIPMLEQYICPMDDSLFQLQECLYDAMVGLKRLSWTDTFHPDSAGWEDSISFVAYLTDDTADISPQNTSMNYAQDDSLYAKFEIVSDGYVYVVATNGADSVSSDFVRVELNRLPSLVVQSGQIGKLMEAGQLNSSTINLENRGEGALSVSINYDRNLITVVPDTFTISGNENLDINVTPQFISTEDSVIYTTLFINSGELNYPIIYHVRFTEWEPTAVDDNDNTVLFPSRFMVSQPRPNPFNSAVSFSLENIDSKKIIFDVYNLLGQNIYSNGIDIRKSGKIRWEGVDNKGEIMPTGIYFFRFSSNGYQVFRKALLLK